MDDLPVLMLVAPERIEENGTGKTAAQARPGRDLIVIIKAPSRELLRPAPIARGMPQIACSL
jgi:hypothetical protein